MTGEPLFHTGITDGLPHAHRWAYTTLYCRVCEVIVHAGNNENMQLWFETDTGPYCWNCFEDTYDRLLGDQHKVERTLGLTP